jgi:cyclic pyranopterin phosphate synthase
VNISLDTLDREKFLQMTRRDELVRVLDGIEAAKEAGFDPVKINAVVERGVNDNEIVALAPTAATTASRCASSSSCRSTPPATG